MNLKFLRALLDTDPKFHVQIEHTNRETPEALYLCAKAESLCTYLPSQNEDESVWQGLEGLFNYY